MTVADLVRELDLQVAAGQDRLSNVITGGYASDLLSCVMAKARAGNVWVTLQAHVNVVAVAELLNLAAVIITEGARPSDETLARAVEKNVPLLLAQESTFAVVGKMYQLGIASSP